MATPSKVLIPQQEYNNIAFEKINQGAFSFSELWRPNLKTEELVWWVPDSRAYLNSKRIVDIALSVLALVLLAPLMILISILIRIDSPGPVFFRQVRVGKWGRLFSCLKFRSMYLGAEERMQEIVAFNEVDGPVFKIKEDPRITRVGKVIRKLSIDEIPQLFNVLRGEMSLVGPRPPLPSEVIQYEYYQLRRLDVTPGITGLQQVSGRSDLNYSQWIALDIEYIQRRSLWFDLLILLRTLPAVISTRGAY